MHQPVMVAAQQHQVLLIGGAGRQPVLQVVGMHPAVREHPGNLHP